MSSIVLPDDILKHQNGLCSQQTIVFMHVLHRKNITVRSVGLGYKEGPGHFLCEVQYNGGWHIHDVSVEPVWSKISNDHLSMEYYLMKKDSLFLVYESRLPKKVFFKLLEQNTYGSVNEMPAQKMSVFHRFTFILIYILPAFLLYMTLRTYRSRTKKKKIENEMVITDKNTLVAEPCSAGV
jgi:hypothetical protein